MVSYSLFKEKALLSILTKNEFCANQETGLTERQWFFKTHVENLFHTLMLKYVFNAVLQPFLIGELPYEPVHFSDIIKLKEYLMLLPTRKVLTEVYVSHFAQHSIKDIYWW